MDISLLKCFLKLQQGCLGGLAYLGNVWLNVAFYVDDSTSRRCRARGQVKMASGDHHDWAGGRHGQDPIKGAQTLGPGRGIGWPANNARTLGVRPEESISVYLWDVGCSTRVRFLASWLLFQLTTSVCALCIFSPSVDQSLIFECSGDGGNYQYFIIAE